MLIKKFLYRLRCLIFPDRCIVCGKISANPYFCKNCKGSLTPFDVKLCSKCGAPLKHCTCKFYFYYFDSVTCLYENDGAAKESLYRFKFGGALYSANYFANQMGKNINRCFSDISFDYITAIPMHRKKKAERGYNQAEVLARKLSRHTGIKYKTLLIQPKPSNTQHKLLTVADRFLNVKDRFVASKPRLIKGKKILVIDDIMTTGATLSEAARQLKLSGADKVFCATALKTVYKKKLTLKKKKPETANIILKKLNR